jgi:hypothetical protein
MHAAVFEAPWDAEALMPRHRAVVAQEHGRQGREVMSLDWTLAHHEWGPKIYGVTKNYDYGERRMARFQTVVTAVVANRALVDGIEVRVQEPSVREAEEAYVQATARERYGRMEHVRARLLEVLHHLQHRFASKTIHCTSCLHKVHRNGSITYYHQMLGAAIIHPDMREESR